MKKGKKKGGKQIPAGKNAESSAKRQRGGVRTGNRTSEPAMTQGRDQGTGYDIGAGMLKTSVTSIDAHRNRPGREETRPQRQNQNGRAPALTKPAKRPVRQPQGAYGAAAAAKPAERIRRYYDFYLLIAVVMIFTLGLLMVYSSSQYTAMMDGQPHDYYFKRQLIIGGAGLVIVLFCSVFSTFVLWAMKKLAVVALIVTGVLTLLTLFLGMASHGATRWLNIFGISLQTAEVGKIALIMFMAYICSKYGFAVGRVRNGLRIWGAVSVPIVLITLENLSSGIIMAGICFVMYFVACKNWKWFVILGVLGLLCIIFAKPLMAYVIDSLDITNIDSINYRIRRILAWAAPDRFPDDAYQTLQGLYAIGSGGLTGQGLGESIQKFGALPEAQNDMIFSIICEELGFVGACAVVLIYVFIIIRLADIARYARDMFGSMICVGIMAHISIQVIFNIAVVTGAMPNTGVTLPFISYGGSAVFFTMAEMGMALAVSHEIYTD